jgi:hypothetical protein
MDTQRRIAGLIEKYLDGMATKEEADELDGILQSSPEARAAFQEQAHFHSLLEESFQEVAGSPIGPVARQSGLGHFLRWGVLAASVATAFILGGTFQGTHGDKANGASGPVSQYVAQVTHSVGQGQGIPGLGTYVREGQTVEILDGLLEISFFNGAVATVQAPAKFEFEGVGKIYLREGMLNVNAHRAKAPFTVCSDFGQASGHASCFGAGVSWETGFEAHAFNGQVTVQGGIGAKTVALPHGKALRIQDGVIVGIQPRPALFPSMRGSSDNLVPSGDFEPGISIGTSKLPGSFHSWSGDYAKAVQAEQGIRPYKGDGMLRFLKSYNDDSPEDSRFRNSSCQVLYMLDLSGAFPEGLLEGARITVRCKVNRVDAGPETDNRFTIRVMALAKLPKDVFSFESTVDATVFKSIDSDADPKTWENLSVGMEVLPSAPILLLEVAAQENVLNNAAGDIEFHGHYLDDLQLELTSPPAPAPILVSSL